MNLAFGFSPCPNDTFAFDALVHGRTPAPFTALPALHDIEELNALAREGRYELTGPLHDLAMPHQMHEATHRIVFGRVVGNPGAAE